LRLQHEREKVHRGELGCTLVLRGSRIVLGSYPTPVLQVGERLWTKRDDLTSAVYGGNKVRKLELLLGAARDAGQTRILTLGAVGSHQVVATALYGAREGFAVEAILVPQPASPHAELNVRVALAHGLRAVACPAWSLAPAYVASRWGSDAYFVPLGGSNALGSLGFVDAANELAAQVRAGELPEPDVVVVALGSGGTAAGLAVGFEQAGLRTRVLGVAVAPPTPVLRHMARRLAQKTAALAGLPVSAAVRAAKRIDVEGQWIGRGYGFPTEEGRAATETARASGLDLDPTYTAKAFACALSVARRSSGSSGPVLYWHTLSTAPLRPLLTESEAASPLPRGIASLLRGK
jgi:1-aminocyclopropane-1-carboxylate deaminase/D-cysteine desulfhydrase-like pyridoxal-dependent ACC family enzyme